MSERFNVLVSKTSLLLKVAGVRIPLSPPLKMNAPQGAFCIQAASGLLVSSCNAKCKGPKGRVFTFDEATPSGISEANPSLSAIKNECPARGILHSGLRQACL